MAGSGPWPLTEKRPGGHQARTTANGGLLRPVQTRWNAPGAQCGMMEGRDPAPEGGAIPWERRTSAPEAL